MLIFYIFYFNCDKFGSKGSFFFQNKRSKNIALKEENSAQSCKQRGPVFSSCSLFSCPFFAKQPQVLELKSGRLTGTTQKEPLIPHLWPYLCSSSTQAPTLCDGCGVAFDKAGFTAETASSRGVLFLNVISWSWDYVLSCNYRAVPSFLSRGQKLRLIWHVPLSCLVFFFFHLRRLKDKGNTIELGFL